MWLATEPKITHRTAPRPTNEHPGTRILHGSYADGTRIDTQEDSSLLGLKGAHFRGNLDRAGSGSGAAMAFKTHMCFDCDCVLVLLFVYCYVLFMFDHLLIVSSVFATKSR